MYILNFYNKSVIYNHSYQSISKESDEISYLSNENLNIIKMTDTDDKEQPIPFLVYDSNTKGKYII